VGAALSAVPPSILSFPSSTSLESRAVWRHTKKLSLPSLTSLNSALLHVFSFTQYIYTSLKLIYCKLYSVNCNLVVRQRNSLETAVPLGIMRKMRGNPTR
jgi:hypothetical protein